MNRAALIAIASAVLLSCVAVLIPCLQAGEAGGSGSYQVLAPIRHGNLTIFPVISARVHDTSQFLTLEEGLRSGEVKITEAGAVTPLLRPRHPRPQWQAPHAGSGAEVNRLVLVNTSKRPLLLLAGEIVTGGKQDRIIGKDRLVPADSDPIDLSVFCVEPGRWVATSEKFAAPAAIVQPSVRAKAMGAKNQQQVWAEVGRARMQMADNLAAEPARQLAESSSYAAVVENRGVQQKINGVAGPVERDYQSVIGRLREKNAVGVVVAVNGQLIWADVFASTNLLEKYWPKLVRSYAAESMIEPAEAAAPEVKAAQAFLDRMQGAREVVENEPGLYRHTEISGEGFKIFELTALLPGTGFDLHLAKMAE